MRQVRDPPRTRASGTGLPSRRWRYCAVSALRPKPCSRRLPRRGCVGHGWTGLMCSTGPEPNESRCPRMRFSASVTGCRIWRQGTWLPPANPPLITHSSGQWWDSPTARAGCSPDGSRWRRTPGLPITTFWVWSWYRARRSLSCRCMLVLASPVTVWTSYNRVSACAGGAGWGAVAGVRGHAR